MNNQAISLSDDTLTPEQQAALNADLYRDDVSLDDTADDDVDILAAMFGDDLPTGDVA